jgi:hypothetical protein
MARLMVPCQPRLPGRSQFPRGWPQESPAAVRLCLTYCPLVQQCREAALSAPVQQPGVLAGLTLAERLAERQQLAEAARRRAVSAARRLRQQPGTWRQRRNAAYYQAHRETILASVSARYQASAETIKATARARRAAAKAAQ